MAFLPDDIRNQVITVENESTETPDPIIVNFDWTEPDCWNIDDESNDDDRGPYKDKELSLF